MSLASSILSPLTRLIAGMMPRRRKAELHPQYDHAPLAHTLDVDRVHGILRAAEQGHTAELFGLFQEIVSSDAHIQSEVTKRKLTILGDVESVQASDPLNPADNQAKDSIERLCKHSDWLDALTWLLEGHLFSVSLVEKVYRVSHQPGMRYEISSLKGVPYRLLDYSAGRLRIEDTDAEGRPIGTYHEPDPVRYIVHKGHLLTSPPQWGGPMRAILFWWLFMTMSRDWWIRFIERYGSPFMVGKFESGDDESRGILMQAFGAATRLFGLVVSRETDVEVQQVAAANTGEVFERFSKFAMEQISKLIVGQTLSSDSKALGLGGGAAALHGEVRQDYRQWDGKVLGNTLRVQLFTDYLQFNGVSGTATIQWGGEAGDDAKTTADVVKTLHDARLRVKEDSIPILNRRFGFEVERDESTTSPMEAPAPMERLKLALQRQPQTFDASIRGLLTDPRDAIARSGSGDLSRAFRGDLAPIARIIRESRSAAECQSRIAAFCAGADMRASSMLMEEALVTYAANAIAESRRP